MIHFTKVEDGKLIAINYHDIYKVEQFDKDCTIQISESGRIYHVQDKYSWIIQSIEAEKKADRNEYTENSRNKFIERFCIANYQSSADSLNVTFDYLILCANKLYEQINKIQH
jgi:hypothetical protein